MQTVLTPSVLAAQQHYYGRRAVAGEAAERDPLTEEERHFIEARDSFYLATITESGWPYWCAQCEKRFTQKVCSTAKPNNTVARSSVTVGVTGPPVSFCRPRTTSRRAVPSV